MTTTEQFKVPFIKKGKSRPTTARKRSASPTAIPSSSKSAVVLPCRKATGNLLSAGTKRTATQRMDDDVEDTRDGPAVKWTAAGSHANAALEILAGDEAAELLAKRQRKEKADRGEEEEEVPDDGLYRGQKAYRSHLKKNQEVPKAMRVGPQRSSDTIRTVTIVDYQPDVCKDYKETGYCGFGDTCKFLHDRGTYLAGWQLDKVAETARKRVEDVSDSDSDNEDIPFACLICRKPYTEPVVTRCGHYYCSACAIKRYGKTPKCLACGGPTGGIFNRADKIMDKMKKKREEEEEEEDEEVKEKEGVEIEGLVERGRGEEMDGDDDDSD